MGCSLFGFFERLPLSDHLMVDRTPGCGSESASQSVKTREGLKNIGNIQAYLQPISARFLYGLSVFTPLLCASPPPPRVTLRAYFVHARDVLRGRRRKKKPGADILFSRLIISSPKAQILRKKPPQWRKRVRTAPQIASRLQACKIDSGSRCLASFQPFSTPSGAPPPPSHPSL